MQRHTDGGERRIGDRNVDRERDGEGRQEGIILPG